MTAATIPLEIAEQSVAEGGGKGPSQRDKLISITDRAELWRCPDGIAHVSLPVGDHREHCRVRSQRFRDWLLSEAGKAYPIEIAGKPRPGTFGKNALEDALSFCEASATAGGVVLPAPLRIASHEGALYLDLGTPDWSAVMVDAAGWRIIAKPPVPILRTRRTRPLPVPGGDGSLDALRDLLPLNGEDEWRLTVLWLLGALRPNGPYPILALSGEQGTGKSVMARILRRLVDPCGDDIMQPPREDRDLISAAKSNHVLAFDNLSSMSGELADSLCRLATGGDIGGRLLYTNDETAAFAAQRPIIVNGIPDLTTRGDLASRAIFVRLSPMRRRRTEAELWRAFDAAAPGILGGLLDALAATLRRLPHVSLPDDDAGLRMADFALMGIAAEPALGWTEGSALNTYRRNILGATEMLADLDPIAIAVRALIAREGAFSGLVSVLHARLSEAADLETKRAPGWPKHVARFGEHLRRIAPALRATGLRVEERRLTAGNSIMIMPHVGEASSLSLLGEEEGGIEAQKRLDGEVNSWGKSPTSPTCQARNGGNLPLPTNGTNVGDVGECRFTYIEQPSEEPHDSPVHVGDVGEKPAEFISDLPPGSEVAI
jgi:hypothetical protein